MLLVKSNQSLKKGCLLIAIGGNSKCLNSFNNVLCLRRIDNEFELRKVYNSVDIFVIPSILDNLPNTIFESLMYGFTIIGFKTGGVGEIIIDGVNGYLCENISSISLSEKINLF